MVVSWCEALMLAIASLTRLSLAASSADVALRARMNVSSCRALGRRGWSRWRGEREEEDALVGDEDARLLQKGACDGEALTLAARQLRAASANLRVEAARERVDEAAVGETSRLLDLGAGC